MDDHVPAKHLMKGVLVAGACLAFALSGCSSKPEASRSKTPQASAPKYDAMAQKAAQNARLDYAMRQKSGQKVGTLSANAYSGDLSDVQKKEIGEQRAKLRRERMASMAVRNSQMQKFREWRALPDSVRAKTPRPEVDMNAMSKMVMMQNQNRTQER